MKTFNYTLRQKNEFKFQIKDGRKVLDDINKFSDGWGCMCRHFDTVEQAVEAWIASREEFSEACGHEIKINVTTK